MKMHLISVPYHLGRRGIGMGAGPLRYLEAGATRYLQDRGFAVTTTEVAYEGPADDAVQASIAVDRALATAVGTAHRADDFPLVLSGNCNSCLGTLSGLAPVPLGIVWFDAHGDFNTPATSPSGFFDGMALAIATGQCYPELWPHLGEGRPVPPLRALLLGVRDLDPGEGERADAAGVGVVSSTEIKVAGPEAALAPWLDHLAAQVTDIYLHVDIDVLDPEEAPANEYNHLPNGLTLDELLHALALVGARFAVRAAALTAFNPAYDHADKTVRAGLRVMEEIGQAMQLPG